MASRVASTIDIAAPAEPIWALLCAPNRYPEYSVPTDRMLSVPDEPLREGYVYREFGGLPPFKSESEWRIATFEPIRRQIHTGDDGKMAFHLEFTLEPAGVATRVTATLTLTPRAYLAPVNAVLWPLMMRKRAQSAMDGTLANIKRIAETEQAAH